MPQVAAAWAAFAAANATAAAVITFAAKAILSLGLSMAVGKLTTKKPGSTIGDNRVTIRQAAVPRRLIYGEVKTGGVLAHMQSTSAGTNTSLIYTGVIPPAPHTITVPEDVNAVSRIAIRTSLAGDDETVVLGSGTPAQGEYAWSGNTFTFSAADQGKNVEIQYIAYNKVTLPSIFLHMVIVLAAHEVEEIGDIYFDNDVVPLAADGQPSSGKYVGYALIKKHLGGANQVADGTMTPWLGGRWTSEHRLRGHAYIYVRLRNDIKKFPNGIPNITAKLKGKKDILDPRNGLRRYTNNAALCVADYLLDTKYGYGADYAEEMNEAALIEAANISDENVAISGGTEKRYTCNGVIDTANALGDNITSLASSLGALPIYSGGEWLVRAAAYDVPTITLDESDARGPLRVVPVPPSRNGFNAVKGVYLSPKNYWQPTDYPAVTNALYESQDGERSYLDLDLPFTTSSATAQRLAKIELERTRQGLTVQIPARLSAMRLRPGSTVKVDWTRFGWSEKVFEVLDWEFEMYEDEAGAPTLGVLLSLKETAAGIYDWNSGEETAVDLAPDTDLPSPFDIGQPGMLPPVEALYETREGRGVGVMVTLSCTEPTGDPEHYKFEYKLATAGLFTSLSPVTQPKIEIRDIASGIYDFRVLAINRFGVESLWSQIRYEVNGLTLVPADITGLTVQAISSAAFLQWDQHPDLDVRRGGKIHIRHTQATGAQKWDESYSAVKEPIPGNATSWVLPLKAGSYGLRAEDGGGRLSANTVWVVAQGASNFTYTTLSAITESPIFPGIKSGTDIEDGELRLAGAGLFDSIPDFDAQENIDYHGGVLPSGEYEFNAGYDAGTVKKLRIETRLSLRMVSALDFIDSRAGLMDDWADFDGLPSAGVMADAVIMARHTNDDPLASPTWSTWERLTTGDFEARAYQFKAVLTTNDNAYNVHIDELGVDIKEIA